MTTLKRLVVLLALAIAGVAVSHAQDANVSAIPTAQLPETAAEETLIPTKSLIGIFHAGGLLMWPILGCSFVLVLFTFERWVSLRRGRVIPKPFVRRFMEQLRADQLDPDDA